MGLRYFGIRVRDLERSVRFYTGPVGLKERRRGKMTHGGIWVLLQDPRTKQGLELNWYPPGSPFDTAYEPGDGLDHIGFKVSDPAAVTKKLLAKGAAPALAPTDKDGVKGIFYVKDPDGNWLEFF
jgi:lactoylglutathione lyase